jgi:hypothetical protein
MTGNFNWLACVANLAPLGAFCEAVKGVWAVRRFNIGRSVLVAIAIAEPVTAAQNCQRVVLRLKEEERR